MGYLVAYWIPTISIHAPREGGDLIHASVPFIRLFQSTPPARGATATRGPQRQGKCQEHFNPRPPRGGRLVSRRIGWAVIVISIHAPREGGDTDSTTPRRNSAEFQSTPPARGATKKAKKLRQKPKISIHAPREGGDIEYAGLFYRDLTISIHAPREGGDSGSST